MEYIDVIVMWKLIREVKIMEEIKEELIELGFKTRSAGIVYWSDVIEIIESDNKIIPIMKIYEIISKKRDTSISRVERAMRYSMKEAKLNIQKEYKCKDKISNMKFISLLRTNKMIFKKTMKTLNILKR